MRASLARGIGSETGLLPRLTLAKLTGGCAIWIACQRVGHNIGLYTTHRELVLPAEAERYWKIEPAAGSENVVVFSANG